MLHELRLSGGETLPLIKLMVLVRAPTNDYGASQQTRLLMSLELHDLS